MNQRTVYSLLHRCINHETAAQTSEARLYWHNQWRRFRALCKYHGFID